MREAVRLRPQLLEAHANLARAYTALDRQPEAQAELERVKTLGGAADQDRDLSGFFLGKPTRDW